MVTSQGAMLVIGGRGQTDIWASLNGGARWTPCRVIGNQSVTDSSAVALTGDDRLVIASGSPRADVSLGDQKLTDASLVGRYCGNSVPLEGVGLRVEGWTAITNGTDPDSGNTTPTDSTSSGGLSGMAIVGIVAAVLVALAGAFAYWKWQQKNTPPHTSDPSGLLGNTNGTVEGQTHTNALDSSLLADTDGGHSSL